MDVNATILDIVTENVEEKQPQLYDLTALQKDANRNYGLTASETLDCAQKLYEAGVLTYPRTSSNYITPDMAQSVSNLISDAGGADSQSTSGIGPPGTERISSGITAPPEVSDVDSINSYDNIIRDGSQLENGKLKQNCVYQTGEYEYIYKTDSEGRIINWSTDNLQLTGRENRLPHDKNTPGKEKGDHAGHLAGDRFGGSPQIDNLVSQLSKVNLSLYKQIENRWAKAINEGKRVKVNVDVIYKEKELRPSGFIIKYEIDGKRHKRDLPN